MASTTTTAAFAPCCFGASSTVMVIVDEEGNKKAKQVQDLRKGDEVEVEGGKTATIVCVISAPMAATEPLISVPGGPLLTPHHPIKFGSEWKTPDTVGHVVPVGLIRKVFNFVLDSVHVMIVDSFPCVTLGHGLKEKGVEHEFYGTQRCIDSLKALPGWDEGFISVDTKRDAKGHACAFTLAAAAAAVPAAAAAAAAPAAGAGAGAAPAAAASAAAAAAAATAPQEPMSAAGRALSEVPPSPLEAFHIVEDPQREPPTVSISSNVKHGHASVLINIACPEHPGYRSGADIAVAIDISGSMGADATYEDEHGNVCTDGLSVLVIAQRAVQVIAASLTKGDRLAVIAFDNNARTVLPLTAMDAAGKAQAEAAVSQLRPSGSTNIWLGLQTALDALHADVEDAARAGRQQTVMLLTDGQPNVAPPGGDNSVGSHVKALKEYAAKHNNVLPTIRTFGFGYNLDSDLLLKLARVGGGTFAFIPVTPVMGTVFVHAIANALSMYVPSATISIASTAHYELPKKKGKDKVRELPGGIQVLPEAWGLTIQTGPLQCGSSRDFVIPLTIPENAPDFSRYLNISVDFTDGARVTAHGVVGDVDRLADIASIKATIIDDGWQALAEADSSSLDDAHQTVAALLRKIDASPAAKDERVVALRKDVAGRVTKSFDGEARFKRWGRHYLRALFRAYEVQQCTNVLDFGLQSYGGALFSALREHGNNLFLALPPPVVPARRDAEAAAAAAAAAGRPASPPTKTVDVNNYTTGGGGCFSGSSHVSVMSEVDGQWKEAEIRSVKRGDVVAVMGGNGSARVECVVKIAMPSDSLLVSIPGGPTLTPKHPVHMAGEWRAPEGQMVAVGDEACVYNLVLANTHVLMVDGVPCVTLGHGLTGKGVEHAFYGSQRCIDSLCVMNGWSEGFVQVEQTIRDAEGHATGFVNNSSPLLLSKNAPVLQLQAWAVPALLEANATPAA